MSRTSTSSWCAVALTAVFAGPAFADDAADAAWKKIAPRFAPPAEFAGKLGDYRSPLLFNDGSTVKTAAEWPRRRAEIVKSWHDLLGPWPPLIEKPRVETVAPPTAVATRTS